MACSRMVYRLTAIADALIPCRTKSRHHNRCNVGVRATSKRDLLNSTAAVAAVSVQVLINSTAAAAERSQYEPMEALRGKDYGKSRMT
jgi:hypothetical protein